jgi:hypothetical protein
MTGKPRRMVTRTVLAAYRPGSYGDDWRWEDEWADIDAGRTATDVENLRASVTAVGICEPVLLGDDGRIWDGHHRLRLALELGLPDVPVLACGDPADG